MLAEIQVPIPKPHTGMAHEKLMVMQGDAGIVGAAVSYIEARDGSLRGCPDSAQQCCFRSLEGKEAEKRLIGKVINDALLVEAGQVASEEVGS